MYSLGVDIASTFFALVLAATLDWVPYDKYPQMQYAGSVVTPTTTGNTPQVVSGFEFIQYSVWVKDEDEYINPNGGGIERVINSLVDVGSEIASGDLVQTSTSFQNGTKTKTFIIRAITVPANTTLTKIDKFTPVDTGTGIVKDGAVEPVVFVVTVAGPAGNGGGGSG